MLKRYIRFRTVLAFLIVSLITSSYILFTNFSIVNADNLIVSVFTDKPVYNPGESVIITVRVNKQVGDMLLGVGGASVFVSVIPPGGPAAFWPASPTGIVGEYRFIHSLSPASGGGIYKVSAKATHPGDVPGSAQTTFNVAGPTAKKSVDWRVESPWISPSNPTTFDPVVIYVWLRFTTVSPGPYPVDIFCTVDGILVGGGTLTPSGIETQVYTPPKKYGAGTHTATWVVDPDHDYNDMNLSNNQISFQFAISTPAPTFDFAISIPTLEKEIEAGQTATYSVNVQLTSGTAAEVDLSLSGLPSNTEYQFSPPSGLPTYTSTLTVKTSSTTPPGSYLLTIKGEADGKIKTIDIRLIVKQAPEKDFTVTITPTSRSILQGYSTDYIIQIEPINDFDSTIVLTVSGLPAHITKSFNPNKGEPPFSSILELGTSDLTTPGEYAFTVIASGGGKTHENTAVIIVREVSTIQTIESITPVSTTTAAPSYDIVSMLGKNLYLVLIILLIIVVMIMAAALVARR